MCRWCGGVRHIRRGAVSMWGLSRKGVEGLSVNAQSVAFEPPGHGKRHGFLVKIQLKDKPH